MMEVKKFKYSADIEQYIEDEFINEDDFDNFLNDSYSEYEMFGYSFLPAKILYEVDKDLYLEIYSQYKDEIINDYITGIRDNGKLKIKDTIVEFVE